MLFNTSHLVHHIHAPITIAVRQTTIAPTFFLFQAVQLPAPTLLFNYLLCIREWKQNHTEEKNATRSSTNDFYTLILILLLISIVWRMKMEQIDAMSVFFSYLLGLINLNAWIYILEYANWIYEFLFLMLDWNEIHRAILWIGLCGLWSK